MGRGTLDEREILAIDNIWANIRNYRGELERVQPDAVAIRGGDGGLYSAKVSSGTAVIAGNGDEQPDGDVSSLSTGEEAIVIVSADPETGRLTATRIEAFDDRGRGEVSEEPPGPARCPRLQYRSAR